MRVVVSELRREGQKPQQWILLTNLIDDALAVVRAYFWRWKVERLFFLKKVGFRLEAWRQESGAAIARRLALTSLAGMAIYQLQCGDDDPTFVETLKWVATKGGWLGRKNDSMGPIVLLRGMMLVIGMLSILEQDGLQTFLHHARQLRARIGLPLAPNIR